MSRKPTKKQKEVIDILIGELKSWKDTNDILSPTHQSDIGEFIRIHELPDDTEQDIIFLMSELLYNIRRIYE